MHQRWTLYTERPRHQGHWEAQQCCSLIVDTWLCTWAANEKSSTKEDRPERTALRHVDEVTQEVGQTLAEDTSSHGTKHMRGDIGQQSVRGQGLGLVRVKDDVYNTPLTSRGTSSTYIGGFITFFSEPSFSDAVHNQSWQ